MVIFGKIIIVLIFFREWEKSNNWNELQKRSDKIFFMKKEDILNLPYFDQNSTTITINKFFEKSKKRRN